MVMYHKLSFNRTTRNSPNESLLSITNAPIADQMASGTSVFKQAQIVYFNKEPN